LEQNQQAILEITINAQTAGGQKIKFTEHKSVLILGKNMMNWDEIFSLGAFITSEDPVIIDFSRKAMGFFKNSVGDDEIVKALKLFIVLKHFPLKYTSDPNGTYRSGTLNNLALDHVQYPRETLLLKSGDCDDLAVLYSALLESLGLPSAIAVLSKHVIPLLEVRGATHLPLISFQGKKWLPVDITLLEQGFGKSVQSAYQQISADKNIKIFSILEAHSHYPAIAFENPVYIKSGPYQAQWGEELHAEMKLH
jgi:hypothetical protein